MRLAIILSLALDRRSGRVHGSDLLPADEAVTEVKQLITSGKPLDPRFPIVAAVSFSTLREHRFSVDPAELAAWKDGIIREATTDDLAGALEEAEKKLAASEDIRLALEEANRAMQEAEGKGLTLQAEAERADVSLRAANDALQAESNGLKIRLQAAENKLADIPVDVTEATARTEAIRAKLTGITSSLNKADILKLVEEALAA